MSSTDARAALPSLVADTMIIHHFALADRIDVLGACVAAMSTTYVVEDELAKHLPRYPSLSTLSDLEWLTVLPLDTDAELLAFDRWINLLGAGEYDMGEASVFAVAEVRSLVALPDDRDATKVGRARGLAVHGTVWLLTRLHRLGRMTQAEMSSLVDALRATGMRLPCTGAGSSNGPTSAACSDTAPGGDGLS